MKWRFPRRTALVVVALCAACAHTEPTAGSTGEQSTQAPDLWEMTIMAGRLGVMLSQAREILQLPEPNAASGAQSPSSDQDEQKERQALAEQQVSLVAEYFADAAHACGKADLPESILAIACKQDEEAPSTLLKQVPLDPAALEARNEALGDLITPWWSAACAYAISQGGERMDVCPME